MKKRAHQRKLPLYLTCLMSVTFFSNAYATDPTIGVARLSDTKGFVSFLPSGETTWVDAKRNRPLIPGDKLWSDEASLSALQLSNSTVCSGSNSLISIFNNNDYLVQLEVLQGTIDLHVGNLKTDHEYEIDTPNLVFYTYQPGHYRITVDNEANTTSVSVIEGEGEIYGDKAAYFISQDQAYQFSGTNLSKMQVASRTNKDELARWCADQVPAEQHSASNVSPSVIGYADLDYYGSWQRIPDYGMVWTPKGVDAGWAPYREGQWVWIEPWGWTWVSHEPWGFAPYHYGRWVFVSGKWCWVPGPSDEPAIYAPALVSFLMMDDNSIVGWFPLGPGDVYIPSFYVSFEFFKAINLANTKISIDALTALFDNPATMFAYRYQHEPRAITALTVAAFTDAMLAAKLNIPVHEDLLKEAFVSPIAPVAPNLASIQGDRKGTLSVPPAYLMEVNALVLNTPSTMPVSIVEKQKLLANDPGKGLNYEDYKKLKAKEGEKGKYTLVDKIQPKAQVNKKNQDDKAKLEAKKQRERIEKERLEKQKREEALIREQERKEREYREALRRREEKRREEFYKEEARRHQEARDERAYREQLRRREAARQDRLRRDEQRRKQDLLDELRYQEDLRRRHQDRLNRQRHDQERAVNDALMKQQTQDARRQAEEAKKQAAEAQKQAEEARRQAAELKKQAEENLKQQEQEKQKRDQEAAQKAQEQMQEAQKQAKQQADEANRQAEKEAAKQAEDEMKRQAEEAAKQQAEEAAKQQAEDARRQAEEVAKQQAEDARRQAEEAAKQQAEDARRQAEQEAQRQAEQARQQAEDARRQAEEAAKQQVEDARRQAEQEAQRQAEQARQQAEDARRQAEQEAQRQAEQARQQAEEARRQAEEAARQQAEEARRQAEEAAKQLQQQTPP